MIRIVAVFFVLVILPAEQASACVTEATVLRTWRLKVDRLERIEKRIAAIAPGDARAAHLDERHRELVREVADARALVAAWKLAID